MPNWARCIMLSRWLKGAISPQDLMKTPSLWVNRIGAMCNFEHDATEHAMRTARNRN